MEKIGEYRNLRSIGEYRRYRKIYFKFLFFGFSKRFYIVDILKVYRRNRRNRKRRYAYILHITHSGDFLDISYIRRISTICEFDILRLFPLRLGLFVLLEKYKQ